jgi:two-component system OmpR family sensor kinase
VTPPVTIGRGLGRAVVTATIVGVIAFAVIHGLIIYITENGEECAPGVLEDPPLEILEQGLVAVLVAAPIGVAIAMTLGNRLTHDTTDRLDDVIASAASMTGERLDARLPMIGNGDPLDRLSEALNGVLGRVESGVAAQRQFAADASHELRTPLAVISTNLEVARRKARDAGHWEHVADEALAEVRRMNQLVDKLLVLSRAGAAGLQHELCELRVLASAATDRATAVAAQREIQLEVTPGAELHAEIDRNAMAIVLDNLLRNAIDHSPRGGTVSISIDKAGACPRIIVDDRGPGVPQEMRLRVFEPFARGTHQTTDRASGTGFGLGLAICQRIVTGHGGTIAIEDRPGGGARFVIVLPKSAATPAV